MKEDGFEMAVTKPVSLKMSAKLQVKNLNRRTV